MNTALLAKKELFLRDERGLPYRRDKSGAIRRAFGKVSKERRRRDAMAIAKRQARPGLPAHRILGARR